MASDFDSVLKKINKNYGATIACTASSDSVQDMTRIEIGIPVLDMSLGGGFPHGRMVTIKGEYSCGKSALAYKTGAAFQRVCRNCRKPMVRWNDQTMRGTTQFCCKRPEPMRVVLVDLEDVYEPTWGARLGLNNENLIILKPSYGEQAVDVVQELTASKMVDLIIADSVAQVTPSVEIENSAEKAQQGAAARLLNKGLRKWLSTACDGLLDGRSPTSFLLINQIRMKTGVVYGDPRTSPGGKGIEFYSSVVGEVVRKKMINRGGLPAGQQIEVTWKKNKVAPPFRSAFFTFAMNAIPELGIAAGGTDTVGQIFRLALFWGEIDKAGAWYETRSGLKAQGEEKMMLELSRPENEAEVRALYEAVRAFELRYAQGEAVDTREGSGIVVGKGGETE